MRKIFAALFILGILGMFALSAMAQDPPLVPIAATPLTIAEPPTVSILAVGDMMIGNWGEDLLKKNGANYPFIQVQPYIENVDIATGNLEGPHCTQGTAMDKKYVFKMPPSRLDGYKWAGFDVFTVANNHAMDYGPGCFLESLAEIEKHGMKYCGGGKDVETGNRPVVIEKNGVKVAFLGYSLTYPKEAWASADSPGTIFAEHNRLVSAVQKAAAENDLVVVQFHWGEERKQEPKDYQRDLARLAIDEGADLVMGHHPHILQGVEAYKGRLIFYSLGNFIFASYSNNSKTSAMAEVKLDKTGKLVAARMIPVNIFNYDVHLQPVPKPADSDIVAEIRRVTGMIGSGTPAVISDSGAVSLPE